MLIFVMFSLCLVGVLQPRVEMQDGRIGCSGAAKLASVRGIFGSHENKI